MRQVRSAKTMAWLAGLGKASTKGQGERQVALALAAATKLDADSAKALMGLVFSDSRIGLRGKAGVKKFKRRLAEVGKSVARVAVPRFEGGNQRMIGSGRPWIMNGTGWLVGRDLLITNHHVVNAREQGEADASASDLDLQAQGTTVSFDFDTANANTVQIAV